MCKGKNFIDFPIGNIYKTNKQAGGNVKNLLNKSQRLPADIPLKHLRSFPKLSTIILFLFILYFKFKYDEYNILLKQLIQLCYNTCPVRY